MGLQLKHLQYNECLIQPMKVKTWVMRPHKMRNFNTTHLRIEVFESVITVVSGLGKAASSSYKKVLYNFTIEPSRREKITLFMPRGNSNSHFKNFIFLSRRIKRSICKSLGSLIDIVADFKELIFDIADIKYVQ